MVFDECKRQYDGYNLNGVEIYNSNSVVVTMDSFRTKNDVFTYVMHIDNNEGT